MKICIVGAGAIGGLIGASLAGGTDAEVCALARGKTLQALREQGWRVRHEGVLRQYPARAADDTAALGEQDAVIIAVKGPALTGLAPALAPLIGSHTVVVPAMNGVPWWFCDGVQGFPGGALESVDPGGVIARAIPYQQVIGCVVHASASTSAPGLVEHKMGKGLIIGEPGRGGSERTSALHKLLGQAGFDVSVSQDIRQDIWYKLWENLTMNPVSAITGATTDKVLEDPLVRQFCTTIMQEAAEIGGKIGCNIDQSPEDRHQVTAKLGPFKTSMLQDAEAGRAIEIDAIVGAVHEIALRLNVPAPGVAALYGLARLFGRAHGLY